MHISRFLSKYAYEYSILLILLTISCINAFGLEDAETSMTVEEIIQRWGYRAEVHSLETEDGYILTMFRIVNKTISTKGPRPVVLFQHGLLADCVMWISNLPSQDAPYIFADHGFDVWLGNFRGSKHGRRHVTLDPSEDEFWEFSWDQMAKYDLPAMINLVLKRTQAPSLYYIGHSMGTLTAFAAFSENQELARKVKKFYALAPVVTLKNVNGAAKLMTEMGKPMLRIFEWITDTFGIKEFFPSSSLLNTLSKYSCAIDYVDEIICSNILFLIGGPNTHQMNITRLPVFLAHTPGGTSARNMMHFGQMLHSGAFQKYDYRKNKNLVKYGTETAPLYDLGKVKVPVDLYWGEQDWLATAEDVKSWSPQLKTVVSKHSLPTFNHLDFLWGMGAAEKIYFPIMRDIQADFAGRRKNRLRRTVVSSRIL